MIQVLPREVRVFYGTGGAGISDHYDLLDIANHGPIEHVPVSQSYIMSSATGEFATGERATGGLLGPDDRSHRTLFLSADNILDIREPDSPLYDPLLARLNVEIQDTDAFRRSRNDGAGLEARYGAVLSCRSMPRGSSPISMRYMRRCPLSRQGVKAKDVCHKFWVGLLKSHQMSSSELSAPPREAPARVVSWHLDIC